jgi:hypothetical protein
MKWTPGQAKGWPRLAGLIAMLLLGTMRADATTVAALSNRALAQTADIIVIGRCTSVRSAWVGRTLVTQATIGVTESLKGDARNTLTVTLPGGIDAARKFPVSMVYAGAPQIAMGEEVFLFLGRSGTSPDGLVVLGFSQGKFSIVSDETGQRVVSRNLSSVTLASPAGTRPGTSTRTPLARFRDEIRGYLQP